MEREPSRKQEEGKTYHWRSGIRRPTGGYVGTCFVVSNFEQHTIDGDTRTEKGSSWSLGSLFGGDVSSWNRVDSKILSITYLDVSISNGV